MSEVQYIKDNFPFMTSIIHNDERRIGIIQNMDGRFINYYDIASIPSEQLDHFIEMGSIWWNESNRKIPINIFLKEDMVRYKLYIKVIPINNSEFEFGPVVSLNDLISKRVKRKQISLKRAK